MSSFAVLGTANVLIVLLRDVHANRAHVRENRHHDRGHHHHLRDALGILMPFSSSFFGTRKFKEKLYKGMIVIQCFMFQGDKISKTREKCNEFFFLACLETDTWSESSSFLKLPLLSTHRALLIHLLAVEPFHDAVDVETVGALAPNEGAVIAGEFAVWAATVKGHTTNAAIVIVRHPLPNRDSGPILDFHFHTVN